MTCVTFQQALETLQLIFCHSYGVLTPCYQDIGCTDVWNVEKREWFVRKLQAAEKTIERELGAPLCPKQIRDEPHPFQTTIFTRQRPIAYLGVKVETYIDTFDLEYDVPDGWDLNAPFHDCTNDQYLAYVSMTDGDLEEYSGVSAEDIVWKYPASCNTRQELQEPCYQQIWNSELDEYVHVWAWSKCQLLKPDVDSAGITEEPEPNFLSTVDAYYHTIDSSQAVIVPPGCGCDDPGSLTVEIGDAYAGEVCITGNCDFNGSRFYLNYGTAFGPSDVTAIDQDIVEAVVLLALTLTGNRRLCGCEDFSETVNFWLEQDPDSRVAMVLPSMIPYGGTRAGMQVMRIINRLLKRPHFNQPIQTGGSLISSKMRSLPHRRRG